MSHAVTVLEVPVYSSLCNLAFALRREVFVVEQQVKDEEFDDLDRIATHFVALADGEVVGTLRLVKSAEHTRVGRVAVSRGWRGQGVGRKLMEAGMALARQRGETRLFLCAQADKAAFYEKHGFVGFGEVYDDGSGIPHRDMRTY